MLELREARHISDSIKYLWYRVLLNPLTHEVPVFPSYRNQQIDLYCKSIDWFLYEGNTGT